MGSVSLCGSSVKGLLSGDLKGCGRRARGTGITSRVSINQEL